jgi:ribose transport system ATP-binding protein
MDLVEVQRVTKRFGGVVALNEADFSARAGEVHALIGENGAGKSTLIQILSGTLHYDGGEIRLDGRPYRPASPDAARDAGIAAVFQELSLIPDLTVEQNVWFRNARLTPLATVDAAALRRRTLELFERYRFPVISPGAWSHRLNLAERQIVEIAKGLAKSPRVLILDEATSALPAREAEWLLGLTRQLATEGKLVIFISHRMGEVRQIADRITIFRNGTTVAAHAKDKIDDDAIVTRMIGRPLTQLYPPKIDTSTGRVALTVRNLKSGTRLNGVDFDLVEGEILGVGGLQGHGQSELFKSLFGVRRSNGNNSIWGKPSRMESPRRLLTGKNGIALVPEDRRAEGLLLAKSVRENLTLSSIRRFARNGLLSRGAENALVQDMVRSLRIKAESPEQPAGSLSGGNQQKVLLGKMLLSEARILLLYDPTRGVDVGTKGEIFQLMRELASKRYAILFYSSDLSELVHMANRVMVLRQGRVATELRGDEITENNMLRAAVLERAA